MTGKHVNAQLRSVYSTIFFLFTMFVSCSVNDDMTPTHGERVLCVLLANLKICDINRTVVLNFLRINNPMTSELSGKFNYTTGTTPRPYKGEYYIVNVCCVNVNPNANIYQNLVPYCHDICILIFLWKRLMI